MITLIPFSTLMADTHIGSLHLLGIFLLITTLVLKEIVSTYKNERAQKLSKFLNIAVIPLLMVFLHVTLSRIAELLR